MKESITTFIRDRIEVQSRSDVLRLHLIIKSFQAKMNLSIAEVDMLVELWETGYNKKFFENCVGKSIYRSEQTVRNAIARMTKIGILDCERRGERRISKDYLPGRITDRVIFQYLVGTENEVKS